MLYTQPQLISFAAHCLKEAGLIADVNHPTRLNWETDNNIQPLQAGQEIVINTVDGLKITAEISTITSTETL